MLLGPQNIGRVVGLPEADLALVQMDAVPTDAGAMVSASKTQEEHFTYLDLRQVWHDRTAGYWRPNGTVGDRCVFGGGKHLTFDLFGFLLCRITIQRALDSAPLESLSLTPQGKQVRELCEFEVKAMG